METELFIWRSFSSCLPLLLPVPYVYLPLITRPKILRAGSLPPHRWFPFRCSSPLFLFPLSLFFFFHSLSAVFSRTCSDIGWEGVFLSSEFLLSLYTLYLRLGLHGILAISMGKVSAQGKGVSGQDWGCREQLWVVQEEYSSGSLFTFFFFSFFLTLALPSLAWLLPLLRSLCYLSSG